MTKNNFSEKLKELRLKNNYTQKFVADFCGLTQRQYQYCEMGHIPSQFDVVIKMCVLYDIDANELFGIGKENKYPIILDEGKASFLETTRINKGVEEFFEKYDEKFFEKYDFDEIAKEILEKENDNK